MFHPIRMIKADLWHIRSAIRASREFALSASARASNGESSNSAIPL